MSPLALLLLSGKNAENRFAGGDLSEEVYTCLPCREGCSFCTDDTPCYAQEDKYLRLAIISFQTLCMLLDFISMLVVYHFRKAKVNPRVLLRFSSSLCATRSLSWVCSFPFSESVSQARNTAQGEGGISKLECFPKLFIRFWGRKKTRAICVFQWNMLAFIDVQQKSRKLLNNFGKSGQLIMQISKGTRGF